MNHVNDNDLGSHWTSTFGAVVSVTVGVLALAVVYVIQANS